ncbi:MAG: nodulation protein NfeD, partial [Meiothermus silvanus]|nr:nodulation protein NfeD [Allomeiothermus silvanus]
MKRLLSVLMVTLGLGLAKTYVIPIEGAIDLPLATFLEQSLDRAEREGASGVVFRVDTPGG